MSDKTNPLYDRGNREYDDPNFYVLYLEGEDQPRAGYIGGAWDYDAWYDFEHDLCGSALGDIVGIATFEETEQLFSDMNESVRDGDNFPRGEVVKITVRDLYTDDELTGLSINGIQRTAAFWILDEILDSGEPMHSDIVRELQRVYGG
jgi:hypothetical protein